MAITANETLLTIKTKGDTTGLKQTTAAVKELTAAQKLTGDASQKSAAQLNKEEQELKDVAQQARIADRALKGLGRQNFGDMLASTRHMTGALSNFRSAVVGGLVGGLTSVMGMNLASGFQAGIDGAVAFERNMVQVGIFTAATDETIQQFRDNVKQMSKDTMQSTSELAEGFYVLASAGQTGAEGMDLLDQAGKAASMNMGTLKDLLRVSAGALEVFGDQGLTAAMALSQIKVAADVGNFDADALASELGAVLPAAKAAGAGFDEVVGSISRLTLANLSVGESSQRVEALFRQMQQSSPQAARALGAVGMSFNQLKQNIADNGLIEALTDLDEKLETRFGADKTMVLRDIFQDNGAVQAFQLLVDDAAKSTAILGTVAAATGEEINDTFAEFSESDYGKIVAAQKELSSAMTALAVQVLPMLSAATKFVAENFDELLAVGAALSVLMLGGALYAGYLAIIGLLPSFASLIGVVTGAQWALNAAMTANPIGAIIVIIAGLAAGLVYLIVKFDAVRTGLMVLWSAFKIVWDAVKLFFDIVMDLVNLMNGDWSFSNTRNGLKALGGDLSTATSRWERFWRAARGESVASVPEAAPNGWEGKSLTEIQQEQRNSVLLMQARIREEEEDGTASFNGEGSGSYAAFRDGAGAGGGGGAGGAARVSFAKVMTELQEALALATYDSAEAHALEVRLAQEVNKFKQADVALSDTQLAQLRERVRELENLERLNAYQDAQVQQQQEMLDATTILHTQLGQTEATRERIAALIEEEIEAVQAGVVDVDAAVAAYAELYDEHVRLKRLGALAATIVDNSDVARQEQYNQRIADLADLLAAVKINAEGYADAMDDAKRTLLEGNSDAGSGTELARMDWEVARVDDAARAYTAYSQEVSNANLPMMELAATAGALRLLMEEDPVNSGQYARRLMEIGVETANLRLAMGDATWADSATAILGQLVGSFENVTTSLTDLWSNFFTDFSDGFADSIGKAIVSGESLTDMLGNLARNVLTELISGLVQMGIQWVAMKALQSMLRAADVAETLAAQTTVAAGSVAVGATVAAAWAPAAAAVSLATVGANAAPAGISIMSILALAVAAFAGFALAKGFRQGGYTGNAGVNEVSGVVHGKEYVFDAAATSRIGVSNLDALRAGRVPTSSALGSGTLTASNTTVNVFVENHSSAKVSVEKLSSGDIRVIAREEAEKMVSQKTPGVMAAQIANPNSKVSKAMGQSLRVERRRPS